MVPPTTAKDDQPGPIARRQTSRGGEAFQSVLNVTPWTFPSRADPRNSGQSPGLASVGIAMRSTDGSEVVLGWTEATKAASAVSRQRSPSCGMRLPSSPSSRNAVQDAQVATTTNARSHRLRVHLNPGVKTNIRATAVFSAASP